MSGTIQAKQWLLANPPKDMPQIGGSNATFEQTTKDISTSLPPDHVLLKTISLSNDPAQRAWISATIESDRLYVPPVKKGEVMRARGLCEIVDSTCSGDSLQKGQYVLASSGWSTYAVLPGKEVTPAPKLPGGANMTHYLGALGLTGYTAYYGLVDVVEGKKEDIIIVSGAAGATGSMVVQIAKGLLGCKRVVGLAGGPEKCKWVKEVMGADECIDYKAGGDLAKMIKDALPDGADVYFDNVGGEITDIILSNMRQDGRIAACGAIANYNKEGSPVGIKNWFQIIMQRLQIRGFIVLDAFKKNPNFAKDTIAKLQEGVQAGTIKLTSDMETVVPTKFEDIPKTWMYLFEGRNQGKLVTQLQD